MKQIWLGIFLILNGMTVFGSGITFTRSVVNRHPSTVHHQLPTANRQLSTAIDRDAFYKAMEENKKELVIAQLEELKTAPEELRQAFMGAMLMKRASFIGAAGVKLRYFKEGHKMLESAIKQSPDNAEYRFLRLMIQEHAPGVLGYKDDIQKDCEYIRKSYKSLPPDIQQFIDHYNKKSKFLKLDVS
jgi:hypothetical protein